MKIVFVGAHPDDIELNAGGLASKLIRQGHNVIFVLVTNGDYIGLDGHLRAAETAIEEQNKLLSFGVNGIHYLKYPTGNFMINNSFVADIENHTRNAGLVVTHNLYEIHHDHRTVSMAVAEACRGNKYLLNWITPILNETHGDIDGDVGVEINNFDLSTKLEMIKCHKSEYYSRDEIWEEKAITQAKFYGYKFFGSGYAECYKTIRNLEAL